MDTREESMSQDHEDQKAPDEELQPDTYAGWFINNDKCMHSFFAIGDAPLKCTFCGVGK